MLTAIIILTASKALFQCISVQRQHASYGHSTTTMWSDETLLLAGLDGVIALLNQLLHRGVHLLACKVVDGQSLHYAVRVVWLDLHWKAVDQPSFNAV